MVLHAHMLNPRAFLEDCIRFGHRALWLSGMPWRLVNAAINNEFAYNPADLAKARWVAETSRQWDNTADEMVKRMKCPACNAHLEIPWTTCGLGETYKGTV
jgi:hypothetical protein